MHVGAVVDVSSQLESAEKDGKEGPGPPHLLAAWAGSASLWLARLWGWEQSLRLWDHGLWLTENHKSIC